MNYYDRLKELANSLEKEPTRHTIVKVAQFAKSIQAPNQQDSDTLYNRAGVALIKAATEVHDWGMAEEEAHEHEAQVLAEYIKILAHLHNVSQERTVNLPN